MSKMVKCDICEEVVSLEEGLCTNCGADLPEYYPTGINYLMSWLNGYRRPDWKLLSKSPDSDFFGYGIDAPEYPPDPLEGQYDLICDSSSHQGGMNWTRAISGGLSGGVLRATLSTKGKDTNFDRDFRNLVSSGAKHRGVYHVFFPGIDGREQADHFIDVILGLDYTLPPAIDVERIDGESKQSITGTLQGLVSRFKDRMGFYPMIYTSPGYWNYYVLTWSRWVLCPLWVAHWTSMDNPILPYSWVDWYIWQFTSQGNGASLGANSRYLDINRIVSSGGGGGGDCPDPEFPKSIPVETSITVSGITKSYFGDIYLQEK